MRKITPLKIVFITEIITLFLIISNIMPREAGILLLGILVFYILFSKLEDGLILFIASVPIFIALAFTESFDSLSSARVIILLLFLKWLFGKRKLIWPGIKSLTIKKIFKNYYLEFLVIVLFVIMSLSVMYAVDVGAAIKKIFYLANLIILFPIVKDFVSKSKSLKRLIKAILISFSLVFLIALAQLISVYFFTASDFWNWWADHFSLSFYGENLKQIVKNMNAWFAYSPTGPSVIRLFGSFTDPHSFALYLLLCLPFLISFLSSTLKKQKVSWKEALIILTLFFIVLSGTRGIWFGVLFAFGGGIYLLIRRLNLNRSVSIILLFLVIFISLIPISSVFTVIPQFKEGSGKMDTTLFLKRLASILKLDETSNQGRIYIWRESLKSFKQNPLLGIGIGNFPVVLNQDVKSAKAGSSAHNFYLNFLVESGIFALLAVVLIILQILSTIISILKRNLTPRIRLLITGLFIFLIWVFGYSLFDIALLDERVFLLFLTSIGIIYGIKRK